MSELMNARSRGRDFRWQLLTTVSALALLSAVYGSSESEAADQDADRPTVWIELGGQLERMNDPQEAFSPPFMASITQANLRSALDVQKPAAYAIGGEGKVSFQPGGSDWLFSASVRYGRSNAAQHQHQQTPNAKVPLALTVPGYPQLDKYGSFYPHNHVKFADATAKQSEAHAVLDFQAGKDVGLGMFGNHGSSVFSAGVRFAQFNSKSAVNLHAEPDLHYPTAPIIGSLFGAGGAGLAAFEKYHVRFHDYAAMETNQRSFRGLGPSLSWNASAPFAGSLERGEITLDWGVNAAVLFGRQKVTGHHQTSVKNYYYNTWHLSNQNACGNGGHNHATPCERGGFFENKTNANAHGSQGTFSAHPTAHHSNAANFNRTRSVTVPNLGGFAGVSFRYSDVKVSFGYRADFFFGAIDGGIDTAQKENRGFYGPFATISIGLGG